MADKYAPEDASTPEWAPPSGSPGPSHAPRAESPPAGGASSVRDGSRAPSSSSAAAARAAARSWQPGIIALRPLSFGDIIGAPFKAMQFNRAVVLGGPFVAGLLSSALWTVSFYLVSRDLLYYGVFSEDLLSFRGVRGGTWAVTAVAIVVTLVAEVFARAVIAPGISRAILGEKPSLNEAFRIVAQRFWSVLGLYLLFLLAVAGGVLALVLLIGATGGNGLVAFLGVVGGLVLMAMAYARYSVAGAALILERVPVREALRRSRLLLRAKAWWTVGVGVVAFLILLAFALAIQFGSSTADAVFLSTIVDLDAFLLASALILGVLQTVQQTLQFSFLGGVYTLMYVDRRIRVEGFDLDLQEAVEARAV